MQPTIATFILGGSLAAVGIAATTLLRTKRFLWAGALFIAEAAVAVFLLVLVASSRFLEKPLVDLNLRSLALETLPPAGAGVAGIALAWFASRFTLARGSRASSGYHLGLIIFPLSVAAGALLLMGDPGEAPPSEPPDGLCRPGLASDTG